jgi:endonuclease/exonuclease/phosphatase family metal-dependent hydrolase
VIDKFETMWRRARRWISRSEWAIRRLRLPTSEDTGTDPGLLLIQLDGLSRRQMERAMKRGRLPFLRWLLRNEKYELDTFYSGLPSATPAVQGELFYGVRSAVPAFGFVNRKHNRTFVMFRPDCVRAVEAQLKKKGAEGLLKGGSSWVNTYTGGANLEDSQICAANIGFGKFVKSVSPLGLLGIILSQFPAVFRIFVLLIVEVFLAVWDVVIGIYRGENIFKEIKFLFARVAICVGLRECATIGASIDLARGLPIVHVNFLGYDEQSHRRGPNSAFAHWSLKGIDRAVERLYREAQRSTRRDYQVWVFSDHGQERTRSYEEHYPEGIEAVVKRGLGVMNEKKTRKRDHPPHHGARVLWAGGPRTERRLRERSKAEMAADQAEPCKVVALGPVGHVYTQEPLDLKRKEELAHWLVHKGHVPGVLFSTRPGEVAWFHARGKTMLPQEGPEILPHPGALKEEISRDLVGLVEHECSGDLVLFGWTPDGPPWTFPVERGAHAGPGLDETQGFALLPSKTRLPDTATEFIRPSDLRAAARHLLGRERLPAGRRAFEERPERHLRIMTYNVHSCIGMDGRVSPQRIARIIQIYNPDVIALQEIDLGRARTRGHDQAKMIAEELCLQVCFCPTVVRGNELYGHALLSRFPIEVVRSAHLKSSGTGREPRGALWARIEVGGLRLHLINTHFGLGRFESTAQAMDILGKEWIGGIPLNQPLIVCGDFNMLPDSLPYRALTARLHDVQRRVEKFRPLKTFAAIYPFSRIDHIFVSPHFAVNKIEVPRNHLTRVASDHLPLIVDVTLLHEEARAIEPGGKWSAAVSKTSRSR